MMITTLVATALGLAAASTATAQQSIDFDANGALDYRDLVELERLYTADDARADVNADGTIDVFDLLEFHDVFAMGFPGPELDFTFDGTLYNGMGAGADHMAEKANLVWGNTASNFVWLDQTSLGIRDVRHFKTGLGMHLFHIDFGWSASGGPWDDCDVAPSGTPSSSWGYGGSTSHPGCTATPTPLCNWIESGKDLVQSVITEYETAYGSGSSNGLKILFDNESIMDRGGKVGLGLRTGAWCQANFYEYIDPVSGQNFIDEYSVLATDALTDYIVALKTAHPGIDFAWYGIPHHSRYGSPTKEFLEGLGEGNTPPCTMTGSIPCVYWTEMWDDARDASSDALLEAGQFVDGHSYSNAVLTTVCKERAYHEGNLGRMASVASAADRPLVASYWIECPPDSSATCVGAPGVPATEYNRLVEFFEECVEQGIDQAAVMGDWNVFKQLGAQEGKDPGEYWRDRVVAPAVAAGFLDTAGPDPATQLTLASVTPSFGEQGEAVAVVLHGSGFDSGTVIDAGPDITVSNLSVVGDTLEALFTIDGSAALGKHAVTVANSTESSIVPDALVVATTAPAPAPIALCNPSLERGFDHSIAIVGQHFQDGITYTISPSGGITTSNLIFVSSRLVIVPIDIGASATLGERAIQLENPDSQVTAISFDITDFE